MDRSELLQQAKPILFNTEMVRAILDNRKTVTRRVAKKPQIEEDGTLVYLYEDDECFSISPRDHAIKEILGYASYQPGDILYVRETWAERGDGTFMFRANYSENETFFRDGEEIKMRWRPSIHMPKEAARIFLKVTDAKVERLNNMTVDDVHHEGVSIMHGFKDFIDLWNSTIKKKDLPLYGWKANPWVWAIEFERLEAD